MVKRFKPTIVFREIDIAEKGDMRDMPRRLKQLQWNVADAFRQVRSGVQSTETRVETIERTIETSTSTLIWKWNGYDTSQFSSEASLNGFESGSLAIVDDDDGFPNGKCIEMTAARGITEPDQGFSARWAILATMPSTGYVMRFRVKSMLDSVSGTGAYLYTGMQFLGCSAGWLAWGVEETGNAWTYRVDGTSLNLAMSTMTVGAPSTHGALCRLELYARPRPANYPVYRLFHRVFPETASTEGNGWLLTEYNSEAGLAHSASWDGKDPRNVGIIMFTSAGATLGTAQTISARISDIEIHRLPGDQTPVLS